MITVAIATPNVPMSATTTFPNCDTLPWLVAKLRRFTFEDNWFVITTPVAAPGPVLLTVST
jgi:hypothetical protein